MKNDMSNEQIEELVSTSEAAELLKISRTAVLKRINKGQLKAYKVGKTFVISKRDIGLAI